MLDGPPAPHAIDPHAVYPHAIVPRGVGTRPGPDTPPADLTDCPHQCRIEPVLLP